MIAKKYSVSFWCDPSAFELVKIEEQPVARDHGHACVKLLNFSSIPITAQ